MKPRPGLIMAGVIVTLAAKIGALPSLAHAQTPQESSLTEEGKRIAFSRNKGNCLACHQIEGGVDPGNIGPPLVAMSQRYPDKKRLRAQIWNAQTANPDTVMPPFGRHEILSEKEIDAVVEFIYSK